MVRYISHRGESTDAPENTIAAYQLSLERQSDGMECDVRLSADGKVIISHDATLKRMGGEDVAVEEITWDELQKYSVSGIFKHIYPDQKVPLLTDSFRYLGAGREYYIELKGSNPALIPAVKAEVENLLSPEQAVFITFNKEFVPLMKAALPQYRCLWLTNLNIDDRRMTPEELVATLKELGADGVDAGTSVEIGEEYVRAVHDAGMIFAVWTVDNPFVAQYYAGIGVDAITSNRAAWLKNF